MTDIIVIAIVGAMFVAAIAYIVKEKKRGTVCIGCPSAGTCGGGCTGCHGSCSADE